MIELIDQSFQIAEAMSKVVAGIGQHEISLLGWVDEPMGMLG